MTQTSLPISVVKASGEVEPFGEDKVRSSLKRAGADPETIEKIVAYLQKELYDGISTKEIYARIFKLLKEEKSPLAYRYNLKHAIMQLGPTGFPFEKFVAGVMNVYGYQTEIGKIVEGRCVSHEIDVCAQKDPLTDSTGSLQASSGQENEKVMVECKYHNRPGTKTEIKSALYVYARFLDVQNSFNQGWLVTNTKATNEACRYAECVGLKLVSWDYPEEGSLRSLIERSGLHPITALDFLSRGEKQRFLSQGIIFQKDLPSEFLKHLK